MRRRAAPGAGRNPDAPEPDRDERCLAPALHQGAAHPRDGDSPLDLLPPDPIVALRPIIAARSYEQVEEALGVDEAGTRFAARLRTITVRPVANRRVDIEKLLDELLKRDQYPHPIKRMIGESNLAAVIEKHSWKDNFGDVRDVLRISRGLFEGGKTQVAGAELLGMSQSTLSEQLKRWGMKWPPSEGLPPR